MDARTSKSMEGSSAGHRGRLRERLLDAGPEGFHDYELIEYLLTLTIPRVDTKPLAKRLLDDFGGIGPLLGASADTLRREGLTEASIAALKIAQAAALRMLEARIEGQPVLSSWDALGDYLHATMAHRRTEEVRILFLNARNMLLANEALWQGSVDEASVHVREVIARAIALGVQGNSLVHTYEWSFLFGPGLVVGFGNGLMLGYLMYRSGLVPRGMAILGLIGGPLLILSFVLQLFDVYENGSGPGALLSLPEIAWEVSLGIYAAWKGFRTSSPLASPAMATAG